MADSRLIIDVRPGEKLTLSGVGRVVVEVLQKSGQLARLCVTAPREVVIKKVGKCRA